MSKKNSIAQNHKKTFSKRKKNLEIFNIFKNNLKFLKKSNFIVAVSGGPDSLALAALAKIYEYEKNIKVFYVLVDHGIRKNSAKEALKVKRLLKKINITLNILTNKENIKTNVQSKARTARYKLLLKFGELKKIKYILTGHHSDDQIETFLIRLSRGSGVQGLSSMKARTKLNKKIYLIRPLLEQKKKDLIFIAKDTFSKIFKDPSNKNKKYLRTRMRSLKVVLEKSGINHEQIMRSIKNLASTNSTLDNYVEKISSINVKKKKNEITINFSNILLETEEIQIRILSKAIKAFSKSYYPPRTIKISNLIKGLTIMSQKKFTLAKCIIERSGKYVTLKKEA